MSEAGREGAWVREPSRDRRIGRGDDFAADAWRWGDTGEVRYTVVGCGPPPAPVQPSDHAAVQPESEER